MSASRRLSTTSERRRPPPDCESAPASSERNTRPASESYRPTWTLSVFLDQKPRRHGTTPCPPRKCESIFAWALSSTVAFARSSPWIPDFGTSGILGRSASSVTRSNRVHLRYGSHLRLGRLRRSDCSDLNTPLPQLHVVRAIHMASSFLLARLTRLNLALQRRKGRKANAEKKTQGLKSR